MTNGYPEAPAKVGMPITDLIGGSHVAMGVLAALYERERTGVGSYIDLALLDSAFFWSGYFPHYEWHGQAPPPRSGMRHQFICPYGPYLASDGKYVNLVELHQAVGKKIAALVGCEAALVTSGAAASKRRASSSKASRVRWARVRCSGAHHSAIAMLPCGATAAKTNPVRRGAPTPSRG